MKRLESARLRTSKVWLQKLYPNVRILDHDGWDRRNLHYSFELELIDREEFQRRLDNSTTMTVSKDK